MDGKFDLRQDFCVQMPHPRCKEMVKSSYSVQKLARKFQ